MPRRSILKQTPAKFEEVNHTISFPAGASSISARLAAWEETHAQTTDLSALSAFSTAPGSSSGPAPLPPQADAQTHAQRRRSSLKPRTSVASGTYDDSDLSGSDMDEEDDDPNGSLDMDVTRFENATALYDLHGGRKSVAHSRRVSFAPSAAIRCVWTSSAASVSGISHAHGRSAPSAHRSTFTPDKPTAEAQAYEAARLQAEAEAAEAASAAGETSLTRSWSGDEQDDDAAGDDDTDAFEQEASMEIAGDEVTLAFRGHFAGTQIPVSALQEDDDQEEEEEDGVSDGEDSLEHSLDNEDGTMPMDEVTGGVTSAFAAHFTRPEPQQTGEGGFDASAVNARAQAEASTVSASAPTSSSFPLFGAAPASAPAAAGGAMRGGPRPSEVARREDEDDEAIMRELGFARGGWPRKSRVASAIVEEDEDEDESEVEEMEDATGAMEMTTAMGGIIGTASQTGDDDEEDDDEVDSDAEVSMQLTSGNRTVDMTFATDADVGIVEDNVDEQDDDATTAMAEATTYGSILPPPSPAAQGPTVVAAASRTSLGPSLTAPPNPFERAGSAPPFQQPPPKSPAERAAAYLSPVRDSSSSTTRPGLSRALSVPLEAAGGGARTPTRSPFLGRGRYSTSPAPPGACSSPFRSPRRVPLDSPQAGSTSLPPAMLGPKSPAHARRSVSPVKGAPPSSLAKKASAAAATEQDKVDDQPGITPCSRSRSRSRSLSPVKQAQQQPPATPGRAVFQPRALAPPQSAGRSPGGSLSLRALLMTGAPKHEADAAAPADKRLAELKNGGQGEELNLTGSSFDASFSHENVRSLSRPLSCFRLDPDPLSVSRTRRTPRHSPARSTPSSA